MRQGFHFTMVLLGAGLAAAPVLSAAGAVWYVNGANSPGGDGSDWAHAFTTIQSAVNAADSAGGGEVWVTRGIYYEVSVNGGSSLQLKPGVHVYGGFSGAETGRDQRDSDPLTNGRNSRYGSYRRVCARRCRGPRGG